MKIDTKKNLERGLEDIIRWYYIISNQTKSLGVTDIQDTGFAQKYLQEPKGNNKDCLYNKK